MTSEHLWVNKIRFTSECTRCNIIWSFLTGDLYFMCALKYKSVTEIGVGVANNICSGRAYWAYTTPERLIDFRE